MAASFACMTNYEKGKFNNKCFSERDVQFFIRTVNYANPLGNKDTLLILYFSLILFDLFLEL